MFERRLIKGKTTHNNIRQMSDDQSEYNKKSVIWIYLVLRVLTLLRSLDPIGCGIQIGSGLMLLP